MSQHLFHTLQYPQEATIIANGVLVSKHVLVSPLVSTSVKTLTNMFCVI